VVRKNIPHTSQGQVDDNNKCAINEYYI